MRLFNLKSNKDLRRKLRKTMTKAEVILWQILRNKQIGFKFRRQYGIGPYIVDFYCPQLKLVIELDGDVHAILKQRRKDSLRQKFLEDYGCYVKRYWNIDVLTDIDSVVDEIYNLCQRLATSPEPLLRKGGESIKVPVISSLRKGGGNPEDPNPLLLKLGGEHKRRLIRI
jgi:very-short-patch-repair endonuclease